MAKRAQDKSGAGALTLGALNGIVAEMFPPALAESWDNVGLQIGDPAAPARRAMTCLEVTAPTLAEARRAKADAIVAHHPLVFKPLRGVVESRPAERLVAETIRAGIGLVVAHTNMDCAPWGTNQALAEACGLRPVDFLEPRILPLEGAEDCLKLAVFVPEGHERKIIDAIHRGGGGRIGLYTHCTFRSLGLGTFLGGEGSDPFLGKAGRFEQAREWRLEAVVPRAARESVLRELLAAHPYEEPAYDFYPLAGAEIRAGLGCVAEPRARMDLAGLIRGVKRGLGLKSVRLSGPHAARLRRSIRKVAICSGSGGSLLARAAQAGADAFLTGEMNYHHGVEAAQRGLDVIEAGHFESERIVAAPLAERLAQAARGRGFRLDAFAARSDFQPFAQA